jgi:hypothetical protein
MKKYTIEELKSEFKRLGYYWLDFQIIGVRSKENTPNKFDDLIGVVTGGSKIDWYSCTTNPGTYWLKNLLNPKGTALLKPAQYIDTYIIGTHKTYQALVQARSVTVYRDGDKDEIAEETSILDTGYFGINIHRASSNYVSQLIDKWSAGCQVINNPADFKFILDKCKQSKLKHFTYTLLKEF